MKHEDGGETSSVTEDSYANKEKQFDVNATRTRRCRGQSWPNEALAPERRDNSVRSFDTIGRSTAVSSRDLGITGNNDGQGNLPDGCSNIDVRHPLPPSIDIKNIIPPTHRAEKHSVVFQRNYEWR